MRVHVPTLPVSSHQWELQRHRGSITHQVLSKLVGPKTGKQHPLQLGLLNGSVTILVPNLEQN